MPAAHPLIETQQGQQGQHDANRVACRPPEALQGAVSTHARHVMPSQHYKERVCSASAGHRLWVLLHGSALLTAMVSEPT